MFSNHIFQIFSFLQYLIILIISVVVILLSIVWDIYFIKTIIHLIKSYRECIEKAKSDVLGNFAEAALHKKWEIIKYSFLLIINITEFGFMSIIAFSFGLANSPSSSSHIYSPNRITIDNCTSDMKHSRYFYLVLVYENPIDSILVSIGHFGIHLCLCYEICLMKYLSETLHNIHSEVFHYIRRLLIVTSLISVFLIITGSIPQLMIVHFCIEPIVLFIYFGVWVKQARMLNKTLRWRVLEFQARRKSRRLIRRAIISCYQFKILMSCFGIGTLCIILSNLIETCFSLVALILHYGPCFFNYLYGTPYYRPVLTTQLQIDALSLTQEMCYIMGLFIFMGALFIGMHYIVASALFFGGILRMKLKYRFGKVQTRFTPNLTEHLLPQ